MILVKNTADKWEYHLTNPEVKCLCSLLNQFPIGTDVPVKISKTDNAPQTVDRQKLLDESLADHREMLKRKAKNLIEDDKLKVLGKHCRLLLTSEEREMLLQILNDIRVGSWHALGDPENLEERISNATEREQVFHNIMNLAGYFEHHLLNDPSAETS